VGMEIGDWITMAAVVVALGIGLLSLIQNKRTQERIYKNQLCNEVSQWVVDLLSNWQNFDTETECKERDNIDENLFWSWRDISARSDRIEVIAKYLDENISKKIKDIDSIILDFVECVRSARKGEINLEFPKEFSKKSIMNGPVPISGDIIDETEDGKKVIKLVDLIDDYYSRIYEMSRDILEKIGQIENRKSRMF